MVEAEEIGHNLLRTLAQAHFRLSLGSILKKTFLFCSSSDVASLFEGCTSVKKKIELEIQLKS
jgi:hypothetical protein